MSDTKLDIICSEIDVYREKFKWVSYGEYVSIVIPGMSKEQRKQIQAEAEALREERRKRRARGNKNVKTNKSNKHR